MAATDHDDDATDVGWLARDANIVEGLDHLGVQVVSTNIYSRLVPGISNLTDRARHFGFYCWVLDSFARLAPDKSASAWRTWIRRHEFTLSAAGFAAERASIAKHASGGLIGSNTARKLLKADAVDLVAASRIEGGKAGKGTYFQHKEGGYGQYYKGPMTALGLLKVDESRKAPDRQLTVCAGVKLAAAVAKAPGFAELRAIVEEGQSVAVSTLEKLGEAVHPASLEPEGAEACLLRDLLLGDDDALCADQALWEKQSRRRTFGLLLNFMAQGDEIEADVLVWEFRYAVLEERLSDARNWVLPVQLRDCAVAWAAYCQNELLNYALECLLAAVLFVLDDDSLPARVVAERLADWACGPTSASKDANTRAALPTKVGDAVAAYAPPPGEECWGDSGTYRLQQELDAADDAQENAARAARLLLRVAADRTRFGSRHPFSTIPQGEELGAAREIHLATWWARVDAAATEDTRSFFAELVMEWVVYRHLRVATRKLASQGDFTYRFRPERDVLIKCGGFTPTFTNPRLRQAFRMMADVGLLSPDLAKTEERGAAFLRGIR